MTFVGLELGSFLAHLRLCQKNCNKLCQEEGFPAFSSSRSAGSSIRPLHPPPPSPLRPSLPYIPLTQSWIAIVLDESEQNWWKFTEIHVI